MLRNCTYLFLFCLSSTSLFATVCSSIASGNFNNAATWDCGSVPACGDTIIISNGTTVTITTHADYSSPGCTDTMHIAIDGILSFNTGKKLYLPEGSGVTIRDGGQIISGGGSGNSNLIEVGGDVLWRAGDGDLTGPLVLGEEFIQDIISITTGNWDQTSTWDCACLPDSFYSATIDVGHTITFSSTQTIDNLIINGTLTGNSSLDSLKLTGQWQNNGSFLSNGEAIVFWGGILQDISGITEQTFSSIVIQNGSTVSNNTGGLMHSTGNLLIENGSFNSNDLLHLTSDENGTANIGDLTNGTFNGGVYYNRYIDAGMTHWRFFSSPLQGKTVADWDDDFITSGFIGSDHPTFPFTSIYTYNEPVAGVIDSGYVPIPSSAVSLDPGKGFWVWSGDTITGTSTFTIDMVGNINQGDINLPVSYTNNSLANHDGWSMVGNPYPSAINWDDADWIKTNIDDAIYIWNPESASYASYVGGVGNNGGSNIIPSGQAFWVKANATSPALTAKEAVKSTDLSDLFLRTRPSGELIKFSVYNNWAHKDEMTLRFHPQATPDFDSQFDAVKFKNLNTNSCNISAVSSQDERLSIFSTHFENEINIPLEIQLPYQGSYTLKFENISASQFNCLKLKDTQTGESYNVLLSDSLNFTVGPNQLVNQRFKIVGSAKNNLKLTQPECAADTKAGIELDVKGEFPIEIHYSTLSGKSIGQAIHTTQRTGHFFGLSHGTYVVETTNKNSECSTQIDTFSIEKAEETKAYFSLDGSPYLTHSQIPFTNQSRNASTFELFANQNQVNLSDFMYFDTPGEYTISMKAKQSDQCVDTYEKKILVLDGIPNNTLKLFPNPIANHQSLFVLRSDQTVPIENIQIINTQGQVISNQNFDNQNSKLLTIQLPKNITKGIYFISIKENNTYKRARFTVQ